MSPPARARQLALVMVTFACASAPRAVPSQAMRPDAARRETAVVWPAAVREASATGAVVVLQAPPTGRAARQVIRDFFEAVRRESIRELDVLLSDDATISSGPGSAAEPVPKVWGARFKRLEYGFSGAEHPYRSDDLWLFTREQLSVLKPARAFELSPEDDELLAVVTTRDRRKLSGPRHFGRRIEFVLGPSPSGFEIRRMFEDFRLP